MACFVAYVSIQPKPKKGLEESSKDGLRHIATEVSIQPKPKKGLEENRTDRCQSKRSCFNPAEAEEGFRSGRVTEMEFKKIVSIQPKPKKGLEVNEIIAPHA